MIGAVAGLASREGVEVRGMEAAARVLPAIRRGHRERSGGCLHEMLVAIDGPPARASPRSPARSRRRLGFTYLDSGAMYRCVALAVARARRRRARSSDPARSRGSRAAWG